MSNPGVPAEAVVAAVPVSGPLFLPEVARTTLPETRQLMASGGVVIGDVRSELEYQQGHIPGAVWLPAGQLDGPVTRIPKEQQVILYCA